MEALDLSGADTKGFEPLSAGPWPAIVHAAEMVETSGGPNAKLPAGTPMLKVQFRCTDPEYDTHRVFGNFPTVAPPEYDKTKASKMLGNLVNFLIGVGYDEKKVRSGNFTLEAEDLIGRECDIIVSVKPGYNDPTTKQNELRGVKPLGTATAAAAASESDLI